MFEGQLLEEIRKLKETIRKLEAWKKEWLDRGVLLLNEAQTTLWHDGNVSQDIDKYLEDMGRRDVQKL